MLPARLHRFAPEPTLDVSGKGMRRRVQISSPEQKCKQGTEGGSLRLRPQVPRRSLSVVLLLAGVFWLGPQAHATVTAPSGSHTDALNLRPEVQSAYLDFYDLNFASALKKFTAIQKAHADDPLSTVYVLNVTIFQELYRLGLLDTTLYVHDGFLSGKHPVVEDMQVRARVDALSAEAMRLANEQLQADPHNVDALFARGYARSLRATYMAMVEKRYLPALSMAFAANRDHEEVLRLDPKYTDAKLVVGVHEYVLGSLALPLKIMAGIFGIGGSVDKGLADLRDDSQQGTITATAASTSLAIFLRREAQYPAAIGVIDRMLGEYPHDFLFALEYANLLKDDGKGMPAIAAYRALLARAAQPNYFPNAHWDMAWYGLGEALRGQRMVAEAADAYEKAAAEPTANVLLKRRTLLAAGEMRDILHQRKQAQALYQAVLDLGGDTDETDRAQRYLHSPYKGH